ncbi:MAG: XRE family transcriptional regulator [Burkholderiales bacterium]
MATKAPSTQLRKLMRQRICQRIEALEMTRGAAGEQLAMNKAQISRLFDDQDIFSLDRLVDAAAAIGLEVRISAVRPYRD